MFFWFLGTAVVTVWFVFRDPAFDYRLLLVGAVLPALLAAVVPGVAAFHSLTLAVVLLALLMLATPGRKPIRKTLLGLPIGMLLHLVYTGAWTNAEVFWWPFLGIGPDDVSHPVAGRGWWNVPLELAGLVLCAWVVRTADLRDGDRRAWFRRTGQLALPVAGA